MFYLYTHIHMIYFVVSVLVVGGFSFVLGTLYAGRTIKKLAYKIVDRMEEKIIETELEESETKIESKL